MAPQGPPKSGSGVLPAETGPEYLSVSELNRSVKRTIEANQDLRSIWVVGELSNVRKNNTPHLFPRLKDESSEVGLVIWGSVVEKFAPMIREGAKVLVHGTIRVFESRGVYQLYVDQVRPFGVGELFARFEALKKRLKEEGLFDQKRELPEFPVTVGVVTSLMGAAIQDILRNLTRRYPPIRIVIAPVQVQGEEAAEDIASGIVALNALNDPRPDLLIVGRGGGSLEDLWAFNEEVVARALFASKIPTVSAVGHETDFTIADFVADRRAATPTEAAVDVVPDKDALLSQFEEFRRGLSDGITSTLDTLEERVGHAAELLHSLDPKQILLRGYSRVAKSGKTVASVKFLQPGDAVDITMSDGTAEAGVTKVHKTGG